MSDDEIKIHGGRILPDKEETKPGAVDIQPAEPMRSHAPGQTFHPATSRPAGLSTEASVEQRDTATAPEPTRPPESTQPKHHEPLKVSKPKKRFAHRLLKTLLWLAISLLIVLAGALAAIYFLKI